MKHKTNIVHKISPIFLLYSPEKNRTQSVHICESIIYIHLLRVIEALCVDSCPSLFNVDSMDGEE